MQEIKPIEVRNVDKPLVLKGEDINLFENYQAGKLPILTINLTNACNLRCIYCFTDASEAEEGELTLDEWKRVVDEAEDLECEIVHIGGKGEPLKDPAAWDLMKYIHDKGIITILDTNGTMITPEWAGHLFANDVSPVVKIPSFRPEVYDELAGVSGWANHAYDGLFNLLGVGYPANQDMGDYISTRLAVMLPVCQQTRDNAYEVWQFIKEKELFPIAPDLVVGRRAVQNWDKLKLSLEEKQQMYKQFLSIMGKEPSNRHENCQIAHGVFINNTGEAMADKYGRSCDTGNEEFGMNVRDYSIREIFNSLKDTREHMKGHDFRICSEKPFAPCYRSVESQDVMK